VTCLMRLRFLPAAAVSSTVAAAATADLTVRYTLWCPRAYFIPPQLTQAAPLEPIEPLERRPDDVSLAQRLALRLMRHVFGRNDRSPSAATTTTTTTLEQLARRLAHTRPAQTPPDVAPFAPAESDPIGFRRVSGALVSQQLACGFRSIAFCTLASLLFGTECVVVSNFAHAFVAVRLPVRGWATLDLDGLPSDIAGPHAAQWFEQQSRLCVSLALPKLKPAPAAAPAPAPAPAAATRVATSATPAATTTPALVTTTTLAGAASRSPESQEHVAGDCALAQAHFAGCAPCRARQVA